jgi:signal transduction histidine kinase
MANTLPLPTLFAPAERSSHAELRFQANLCLQTPWLSQISDALNDFLLILNQHRQIVFANQAILNLLGAADQEVVIGLRPGEALNCDHADLHPGGCGTSDFCRTCGAVQAILTSLAQAAKSTQEARVIRKSGDALDLLVTATPFVIDQHRFTLVSVKDISSVKRRVALERIFFHDIMNTTSTILGYSELLIGEKLPTEPHFFAERLYESAGYLAEEIKSQQQLNAAENNELAVYPTPTDTLTLLQEIWLAYKNHPLAEDRILNLAADAPALAIATDVVIMRRVLGNMVKNALEATPIGGTVTLACYPASDGVEFVVHNPTVMPPNVKLQVFKRSFSTKGEGRGLGTYSMKLLTERYLSGRMFFTSAAPQGTTFYAWLPLSI